MIFPVFFSAFGGVFFGLIFRIVVFMSAIAIVFCSPEIADLKAFYFFRHLYNYFPTALVSLRSWMLGHQ